jgi:hypothetical protein
MAMNLNESFPSSTTSQSYIISFAALVIHLVSFLRKKKMSKFPSFHIRDARLLFFFFGQNSLTD